MFSAHVLCTFCFYYDRLIIAPNLGDKTRDYNA